MHPVSMLHLIDADDKRAHGVLMFCLNYRRSNGLILTSVCKTISLELSNTFDFMILIAVTQIFVFSLGDLEMLITEG